MRLIASRRDAIKVIAGSLAIGGTATGIIAAPLAHDQTQATPPVSSHLSLNLFLGLTINNIEEGARQPAQFRLVNSSYSYHTDIALRLVNDVQFKQVTRTGIARLAVFSKAQGGAPWHELPHTMPVTMGNDVVVHP